MVLFEDEFKKHKRDWLVERIKQQGADRLIQTKIAAHFKTFDFRNAPGPDDRFGPSAVELQYQEAANFLKSGNPTGRRQNAGSRIHLTGGKPIRRLR